MHKSVLFFAALSLSVYMAPAQQKMTQAEYINRYKHLAIKEFREFQIPASITLAQGILESGSGGSRLATEANNHFGIKCKSSWTGPRIYHDDDAKGECFRKYRSVEESYEDHSRFLKESPRYAALFELDVTDYKGWAYGLKAAGYATNPRYPELLIDMIERNNLQQFDRELSPRQQERAERREQSDRQQASPTVAFTVEQRNGLWCVVPTAGVTLASIAEQAHLPIKKLLKFNDLSAAIPLQAGVPVYLQPKLKRSAGAPFHTMAATDSYYSVAQHYGVTLKRLQKLNPVMRQSPPTVGQLIRLK